MSVLKVNEIQDLDGTVVFKKGQTIANDSVEYLSQLLNVNPNTKAVVNVLNYHNGLEGGGGVFYWDANKAKSEHDGVKIIDPIKTFPSDINNNTQRINWFTPSVSGVGCWVSELHSNRNVKSRGYSFDQETTYAEDLSRFIFGREYLQHVINAGRDHLVNSIKIIHSGDSTTEGAYGTPDPVLGGYTPSSLMTWASEAYGIRASNVNSGKSGQDTVTWDSTYVSQDISAHPDMDLYIARWGINDGSVHGNVQTFETALRSGLVKLRAFKPVAELSIILMMPTSVWDEPHSRGPKWFEKLTLVVRQAARDFNCVFVDTYAMLRDSKNGAGIWMDDPFGDGRGIHMYGEAMASIYTEIARMVFEPLVLMRKNINRISNVRSADLILYSTSGSNSFPYGMHMYRGTTSSGFPNDGYVLVIKTADNIIHQINGSYLSGEVSSRLWNPQSETWSAWVSMTLGKVVAQATPASGFSTIDPSELPIATKRSNDTVITITGGISQNGGSGLPANTVLCNLPEGFRPSGAGNYFQGSVWDGGSTWTSVVCNILTNGNVVITQPTPTVVQRVYFNTVFAI